ncbi:cob(I)yrinic acid a,c-diamide adenosyltransferase [Synchytrium endobioticum]|uniref:Cob(I)yrinic acid a,c-diamide adenosyltransferase n=1 Tax=Synchytrium endobioticum TaxID=286115 RepID=A0A507CVK8_9FUNG|nr:cob(I)yrinic acid a,c-diamide adenosyltransferase [Synchytrium endobioticum]TPX49857.1 cob(I)yrinic acid a,c-diamide adenosyltransferase [Synchytrium endobioticum]
MATSASKRRGGKKAESSHNGDSEEDLEIVSVLAKRAAKKAEQAKKQLDEECQNIQRQLLQAGRDFVTRHTNEVDQITRRHTQRMEELHEERNDLLKKISSESDKLMVRPIDSIVKVQISQGILPIANEKLLVAFGAVPFERGDTPDTPRNYIKVHEFFPTIDMVVVDASKTFKVTGIGIGYS